MRYTRIRTRTHRTSPWLQSVSCGTGPRGDHLKEVVLSVFRGFISQGLEGREVGEEVGERAAQVQANGLVLRTGTCLYAHR